MASSHSVANAAVNSSFLSQADDLCSRILLDIMVFAEDKVDGRRTGKMNKRDVREMRLKESDLKLTADVVQQLRAGTMTASDAGNKLASTAYYKTFVNTWDDDDEDLFLNHVKRYCHAFRPDSGIAFHETDRYSRSSITKSAAARQTPSPTPPPATSTRSPDTFIEVGVFATRNFKKGEIVNLRGGVADLSEEEDDKMREGGGRSDFSVLWSARKKCFGLLLGPARFVNHDCRNNVQFHLTGSNMSFKVMEDIKADEELFTHYGDHYFDKDNAACLCATCQKLKRGAFTPKSVLAAAKRAAAAAAASPAAGDAPDSPARRSGNGGHEVTAQRSVGRPTRSRSSAADEDKRRSERTSVPVDTLRVGERLVHPRLPPPPLYADDYEWDGKAKVAKYIGLVHVPTVHKAKPKRKASTPSASDSTPSTPNKTTKVALGKRKRAESRSESPASSASTPRPVKKKVIAKRMVELKKATPGSRSSSRAAAGQGSASARSRSFDKLKLAMGGGESDDELTDLSSSDEDEGDEIAEKVAEAVGDRGRPVVVVHAKAVESETPSVANDEMIVEVVAPDDGLKSPEDAEDAQEVAALLLADPVGSMAPESPYEDPQPTPVPAEPVKDEPLSDSDGFSVRPPPRHVSPRPTAPHVDPPPRQPPPISTTPAPMDAEGQPSQASGSNGASTTNGTNNDTTSGSASAMSSFCDSRSSIGGGAAGGAAGGSGGDDGEDRRNGKEREKVDEEMRMVREESMMDVDEVEERVVKEEAVEEAPVSAAPSEGGARDEDTAEAAAFLLMLKNTPTIEPAASSSSSLVPLDSAPSPPKPGSSSTSTSSSIVEAADAQGKTAVSTKMATKRSRHSLEIEPHLANNPRSTRRNSQLEEPSPSIALPSPTSAAPRQPKSKATTSRPSSTSRSPRPSDPMADRKPSRPSPLGAVARSSGSPMEGVEATGSSRGTRLSAPIAGKLSDVLKDPAVMSVAGGFDPIANRYVARGRVSEGPEWHPAPLPEPPAPLGPPPRPATAPAPTLASTPISAPSPAPRPPRTRPVSLHNGDLRRYAASPKEERRSSFGATPSTSKLSTSGNGHEPSTPSNSSSSSSRSTRRSAPIEGSVADLVASPAVAAVAGGFDPESGKYTSTRRVVATSSSSAGTPPTQSASPDIKAEVESPRGTRSRAPIAGTVADLVASPEVSAVSGGFNPETGRYTGIRKRGGGAGSPPVGEPRA